MKNIAFILVFLLVNATAFPQYEIKTEKVSERILVVKLINQYGALNVTAISTEKGIAVIDTAWPPAATREIREAIEKELDRDNFAFLINTHGHTDHASGNQVFEDATIIGHDNIFEAMKSTEKRKTQLNLGDDYVMTPPDMTFNDRLILDMGDVSLELVYLGMAHSGADILIYIPEEKLLMVGDTFDHNYLPYISADGTYDVARWITVLDYVLKEKHGIETVISGHRQIFDRKLLMAYLDYLKELWGSVDNAINEGLTLNETKQRLLRSISREAFGHLKSTDEDYERNIEGVWKKIMSVRHKSETNNLPSPKGIYFSVSFGLSSMPSCLFINNESSNIQLSTIFPSLIV